MPRGASDARGAFDDSTCSVEEAFEKYSVADVAIEMMNQLGITTHDKPLIEEDHATLVRLPVNTYFDGRMPPMVKNLSLEQLSSVYDLFQRWYGYIMGQMSEWKIRKSEADRKREVALVSARRRHSYDASGKKNPDQVRNDMARQDIFYIEADSEFELARAMYDLLEAHQKIIRALHDIDSKAINDAGRIR